MTVCYEFRFPKGKLVISNISTGEVVKLENHISKVISQRSGMKCEAPRNIDGLRVIKIRCTDLIDADAFELAFSGFQDYFEKRVLCD